MELAQKDKNVIHLIADSGSAYDEMFNRNFPEQMYNFGIAEQHMVAAAAGMATAGKIPFIYAQGAFLAYRAFEFIRDDICFQKLNVKVVGEGSGLALSTLGPSHHTTEDLSVLRVLPDLRILSPATPIETAACVELAYYYKGPVYMRLGMGNEQEFFEEGHKIAFGVNRVVKEGEDVTVFTTGSILQEVWTASEMLEEKGIRAGIIDVVSIKPFDTESVLRAAAVSKLIVTVEEHNIYGGLGSIVSEVIAESGVGKKALKIGLKDQFAIGYGTQHSVRADNGLDAVTVCRRIMEAYDE